MRVTMQDLENRVERLNVLTNSPLETYVRLDDRNIAQIGNFNIYGAYVKFGLHRITNEGGGCTSMHINGLHSKRELYDLLGAFIAGIEFAKGKV